MSHNSDKKDGPDQSDDWSAENYARNARFVADYGESVVDLLDPQPKERILDLGCGDGALTESLARRAGEVVGIDASADMIAAAQARGLNCHVADAHDFSFEQPFDAVFSNAALHWMKDLGKVIDNVANSLVPGGRFVGEMGGQGNVAAIHTAIIAALNRRNLDGAGLSPWIFPSVAEFSALLEGRGFAVNSIALLPRPTPLPTDMAGWLIVFTRSYLQHLPESEQADIRREVEDLLRPVLCDDSGNWTADYVRLRFAASILPEDEGHQ